MHLTVQILILFRGGDGLCVVKELVLVDTGARADQICVVCRRTDAHGLGGAAIQVA